MEKEDYYNLINRNTTGRYDVSPLFENSRAFTSLINDMIKTFNKSNYDKIVAIDSLGFILGSAMAIKVEKPLILIRKGGKLPYKKEKLLKYDFKDYTSTEKSFEIKKNSIKKGDKILLVDEWIETGTQIKAATSLIEQLKGKVVGIITINADKNKNTELLFKKYSLKSIL